MPLTMRPTGLASGVDKDWQDWTIFDDGEPVGRIYEDASASTPAVRILHFAVHTPLVECFMKTTPLTIRVEKTLKAEAKKVLRMMDVPSLV